MSRSLIFLGIVFVAYWTADRARAEPRLPALARFTDAPLTTEQVGRVLLSELSCHACHAMNESLRQHLHVRQAPILDQVGSRVRPEYLRDYLRNPQEAKPGTLMPDLLADLPADSREEQIEALVHFLASTGSLLEAAAIAPSVRKGDELYHKVGCVACHDPRRDPSEPLSTSVPLPHPSRKYALPGLAKFLADPLAVRPSGRMPHLNLTEPEARDIASFLLKDVQVQPNLRFAYYEGDWQELPDFKSLKPVATGWAAGFDVNLGRPDHFAIRFEGQIRIDGAEGNYGFFIGSDDGSRLYIDGHEVATNNGIHPFSWNRGRAHLSPGVHEIVVEYFEGGGEQELQIEFEGPRTPRRSLEAALVPLESDAKKTPERFVANADLARRGKELFETLGCAACHAMKDTQNRLAGSRRPLVELATRSTEGCLAENASGAPRYHLSESQRASLRQALIKTTADVEQPSPRAPESIGQAMLVFNCHACHQRGELGGVETARNPWFHSDEPEMGDEGRLPPPLTGVGAKLTPAALRQIFKDGSRDRPYMFTRMPRFGAANLEHLVAELATQDRLEIQTSTPHVDAPDRRLKSVGRQLVGGQGLSCIKCHRWGDVKSTGIQAMSLTVMARRLRPEWFQEYMFNPQRFRPGTRMPAAWPMGQAFFPQILEGDANRQIHAVWEFLTDGERASIPIGLGRDPIELVPQTEPLIYRNFIEGAGPRAIGVGYPERVHLAFDANDLRWALIWQGAFIDASRHWLDRGVGFQPPLGDNVLHLPSGVGLARLDNDRQPWPTTAARELGWQFRGYRLDEARRPTFLYQTEALRVEDTPIPVVSGTHPGFQRRLVIVGPAATSGEAKSSDSPRWWFRAAVGKLTGSQAEGWRVDGDLRLRVVAAGATPQVRDVQGQQELLVPIVFEQGRAELLLEFEW